MFYVGFIYLALFAVFFLFIYFQLALFMFPLKLQLMAVITAGIIAYRKLIKTEINK